MDESMSDDRKGCLRPNDGKSMDDYCVRNTETEQKYFTYRSPQEVNKFVLKRQYVSSSKSVPKRSKRFVQYRISRSLNFETNLRNSNSEGSSYEAEDKHLSRSAKIMRALNFNSSPSYYGKRKIKRSLNFNATPSPKRFTRRNRYVRSVKSLNVSASSGDSNKVLNFEESPFSDSANSSLLFASTESIDENQNETPSHRNSKRQTALNYSTSDTSLSKKSLNSSSFSPLMRSGQKDKVDDAVYIAATPKPQSSKCKGRLKYVDDVVMSTPKNLFRDFHEEDDGRPRTPENVVRLIPESMSAIKRSHKKERTSRWNERSVPQSANSSSSNEDAFLSTNKYGLTPHVNRKNKNSELDSASKRPSSDRSEGSTEPPLFATEDDISDTGSIFDYTEEKNRMIKKSINTEHHESGYAEKLTTFYGCGNVLLTAGNSDVEKSSSVCAKSESPEECKERDSTDMSVRDDDDDDDDGNDVQAKLRPVTPETKGKLPECHEKASTPENRINVLQQVLRDSIKKSHKKSKDDNKRKLFTPKVLWCKIESTKKEEVDSSSQDSDPCENLLEDRSSTEKDLLEISSGERAGTPEKVNSSRLLLSQFSSVKKSHKKDKHNNTVSGFLKRQEYFNRVNVTNLDACGYKSSVEDLAVDFDVKSEMEKFDAFDRKIECDTATAEFRGDEFPDKLSPSKRKKPLDASVDRDRMNASCDFESLERESAIDEFKIFTPLKRRRSLTSSTGKEYICFYRLPSGEDDISEAATIVDVGLSRCVTPIASFQDIYITADKEHVDRVVGRDDGDVNCCEDNEVYQMSISKEEGNEEEEEEEEERNDDSTDLTGRSTPRNMSTAELWSGIDSIKKSHKKNKRGYGARKECGLDESTIREERTTRSSMEDFDSISKKYLRGDRIGTAEENIVPSTSRDYASDESVASTEVTNTGTGNASLNKTPPNCLQVKNYIRLLQTTSIKRSHKKVRDQRKRHTMVQTHDLSDDGSLFGDEEKETLDNDCELVARADQ